MQLRTVPNIVLLPPDGMFALWKYMYRLFVRVREYRYLFSAPLVCCVCRVRVVVGCLRSNGSGLIMML